MTRQCHCGDDGDEIVFGACRRCTSEGGTQRTLPPLVPSWRFVVPESEPVLRDRWDMDDDERRGT